MSGSHLEAAGFAFGPRRPGRAIVMSDGGGAMGTTVSRDG